MKIIYDLRILGPRMHGMARYGLELLKALLDLDRDLHFGVLIRRPEDARLLPSDPRLLAIVANLDPYGLISQLKMPRVLAALKSDIYHCPFYAPPSKCPRPMIFTVHDLIHLRFPADHGIKHRLFYKNVVLPASQRARAVLTVSQHSKKDLWDLMGVDPNKVIVTPGAVGDAFRPLDETGRPAARRELNLPDDYVIGVGNPRPHKNLPALVKAHAILKENLPAGTEPPALVLVGVGARDLKGVKPAADLLMIPYMEDRDLARALGTARAACVPSLYEGFGLPALEALACGVPLVTTDRASLPEVVGSAALITGPEPPDLAAALARVLTEPKLALDLSLAGPQRASEFSWEKTARIVRGVYRRIRECEL